jgi:hypothetical protein
MGMKRNLFGAIVVAGVLSMWSAAGSFAADLTPAQAKDAVSNCAKTLQLTSVSGFTGEAAANVAETNADATMGVAEITAEANQSIDEAATENDDEDTATSAATLSAELNAIVTEACQSITALQAEYNAAIAEIRAESTEPTVNPPKPEKTDVEKQDTEKQDVEKPESKHDDSEGSQAAEGND